MLALAARYEEFASCVELNAVRNLESASLRASAVSASARRTLAFALSMALRSVRNGKIGCTKLKSTR